MNKVLSVQELTKIIKGKFDANINNYYSIKGEVINCSDRGHVWFNLKDIDCNTSIRCILWNGTKTKNGYSLENGEIITISGKIGLYEKNNSYSFSVFRMMKEATKETEFKRKYAMFKKLGYFDRKIEINKKGIKNIGLITSFQGEAIKDFQKTLEGRFFCGDIYLYNVNVQGINCASDIIKAIKFFEKTKQFDIDAILITRGGGSSIDLDEFNNERLIEKVHNRKKPIICAIGHEQDFTLLDYTCDLRTSTPTSLSMVISEDFYKINNKINILLENEKNIFEKIKSNFLLEVNNKKTFLYEKLLNHRPNGFYFNKKFINNIKEFEKLSKEKFNIQLEDGVIEFNISDYKVLEKINIKYTYKKYIEIYNNEYTQKINEKENKSFEKYFKSFKTLENDNKFGKKVHFDLFKKLIIFIKYYVSELYNLEEIIEVNESFGLNKKEIKNYQDLLKYKKHINFLSILIQNNFENMSVMKVNLNNNQIYENYLNYDNKHGLTKDIINLYLNLKNIKVKYYKIKS
jgi:exodeoxyribonuclease VII large subunit